MSLATAASVLEQLLQALHLTHAFLDEASSTAGEVAQLSDRLRRHEAPAQKTALGELGQPGRVRGVGLASREVLHVPGVDELGAGDALFLEHVPDRLPIDARGLHDDEGHSLGDEPLSQCDEALGVGRELSDLLATSSATTWGAHCSHHGLLVHVQSGDPLNDYVHLLTS